jgi:hypothetical protein
VIPEIDIWRAANLMLKRYGDKAVEESALERPSSRPLATITARRPDAGSPTLSGNPASQTCALRQAASALTARRFIEI